jgi:predicted transcriptional regulator
MKQKEPPGSNHSASRFSPELMRFIESMGRYFESYGIPRIGGRILGLLLVSHEPLSAQAIASRLKVSRGSLSTNFRLLLSSGLADKVTFPGDRTTYFVFPPDAFEKVVKVELESITGLRKLGQQGLNALAPKDPARTHLESLVKWMNLADEVYQKVLAEWRVANPPSNA